MYKFYSIHYLGVIPWMYRFWGSDREMVKREIDKLCRRTSEMQAMYLDSFLFNGSRRASESYIQWALPWATQIKNGKRLIDFNRPNKQWWECARYLELCCKKYGIHHKPTLSMDRYNYDVFTGAHNLQEIDGFWTRPAADVIGKLGVAFAKMQRDVRHSAYGPTQLICNEPAHHNDHKLGVRIADWHWWVWLHLRGTVEKHKLWVNTSTSEFAAAHFKEPKRFCEPGFDIDVVLGHEEWRGRYVRPQQNGVSIRVQLLEKGFVSKGLTSAWRHQVYCEDGSKKGGYVPIKGSEHRLGTPVQVMNMLRFAIPKSIEHGQDFYFVGFAMDVIRKDSDGYYKEEYRSQRKIRWARFMAYPKVMGELGF